jgi:uncharacterized protein YaeQ
MNQKFTFNLASQDPKRHLPSKVILGQQDTESATHLALKLLAYLLFYSERLRIETRVPNDAVPFIPDLSELDYELRPKLWVECGECSVAKLHKLAVKAPDAEIWVVKRSQEEVEELKRAMRKEELRKDRYNLIGLDGETFEPIPGLIASRNQLFWSGGGFEPPELKFDLNENWIELPFTLERF